MFWILPPSMLSPDSVIDMADVTQLTTLFQQVALQSEKYHRLCFTYPAVDILPEGKRPHLDKPQDVEYRGKPDAQEYQAVFGDPDFFTIVQVQGGATRTLAPEANQADCLLHAIEQLNRAPGRSELGMVAYLSDDYVIHRFRLETSWRLPSSAEKSVLDVEMKSAVWANCMALAKDQAWMRMIQNLMGRESIRAYAHVSQKLLQYNADFARYEDELLNDIWNSRSLPAPSQTNTSSL